MTDIDGQLSLPFSTVDVPCPTCRGSGDVYYIPGRDVIGGKRVVRPTCGGKGRGRVPVHDGSVPA
jgi:hypothetical protein